MAIVKKEIITPKPTTSRPESSHLRQAARRAGIDMPKPKAALADMEQEEVDSY